MKPATEIHPSRNLILAALPDHELQLFRDHGQHLYVKAGEPLHNTDECVYFPTTALISLLSTTQEGLSIEAGMICHEGMLGLGHFLGNTRQVLQCVVQRSGEVCRMSPHFIRHSGMVALQRMLFLYSNYRLTELAQSAVCNKFHRVRQRFSRWLLTAQDRIGNVQMQFSQEMLSAMLGARRPVVTSLIGDLQNEGLIETHRLSISIVDRPGMERAACECYAILAEALRDYLSCLRTGSQGFS